MLLGIDAVPLFFLSFFFVYCFGSSLLFSCLLSELLFCVSTYFLHDSAKAVRKKTKRPSQIHRSTFSYYGNHSSKRSGIRKLDKWLKVEKQEEEEQEFKSKDCFLIHMTYSQQHFPFDITLLK